MSTQAYIQLSEDQLNKLGNALIYLSGKIENLSKTKALKLIYILDEVSIKKSGIPFFNLKYKVWKFGPVSEEIFIDLSSETTLLKDFIERASEDGTTIIKPIKEFNDDEFSDNDIDLMDAVIKNFGFKSAKELVSHSHRKNSPWYISAKENAVLELLDKELINNTEFLVDMSTLINHDPRKKALYSEFIEEH